MAFNTFYNEILTDHNMHPGNKHKIEDPTYELEGVNPSCGDDIVLQLKVSDDDTIEDAAFVGDGCAISQASADMMCDLIKGEASQEEIDELDEAGCLVDISHMPARVKCAVLGWHTLDEIFKKNS